MRVSIITVVRNGERFIEDAIQSVLSQDYADIEYIVIDGLSTDSTLEKIKKYEGKIYKIISAGDKGMYDALNKGIDMATGDVIGILNADDMYLNSKVVSEVARTLEEKNVEAVWGDLVYVHPEEISKIIRTWKSSDYSPGKFAQGWHPPHPTFFVRKEVYEKLGKFNLSFRISADYELMLRFLEKGKISSAYIPGVMVKMRWGGVSNRPSSILWKTLKEDVMAWRVNGLKGWVGAFFSSVLKKVSKSKQFFK